jgi:Ni/Fe-hydrogenase 1 B-type cytochrome subunit
MGYRGSFVSKPADIFYVWHLPVRIVHWVNVVAFVTLVLTGIYIANPMISGHAPPMMRVRMVHVLAGTILACSVAFRLYYAFAGDRGAAWSTFFPYLKKSGWRKIGAELRFYAFLRGNPPPSSTVVNISHSLVFLAFAIEIVTGFALVSLSGSHSVAGPLFGWIFVFVPAQLVRLIHVVTMWCLLAFLVEHIYVTVLLDCKERSGLISSIVTGWMAHERKS